MPPQQPLRDNINRVNKYNYVGASVFIGLRAADVFLQHALLQRGWASDLIESIGGTAVNRATIIDASTTMLQPYYGLISLMAFGSSFKQIANMIFVMEQDLSPTSAVVIALFNTAFNSFNTLLSVWAATSQVPTSSSPDALKSPWLILAAGSYFVGIVTELASEWQRKRFKQDPANKGKPYAGGLFSLARHINYGGYTIWRAAYAFTAGGWPWGLAVFSWFFYDFAARGVPVLDAYMLDRYGEDWKAIKARVPSVLIPGIY
ncbi:hypothetical protein CCHL11_07245 [Colletotrichum chlorophyti]|uniref:Steroid 5-alpha reductase C-terminal domain-containing protein n=1 Tax=Colletotrichum chlorophyti TaxID=708187 RepID=A0A1Q8RXC8_9PEZI|nr:hypothetical protein CCHL11_07245 [Colletotrichum chlorophyti]